MTNDDYQPWIKSLNIGDDIAIEHKNYISHNKIFYTTDKVKYITSDGLIKTECFPYEFEFGISIHDVWDSQTHMLTPITQDGLDSIEKRHLYHRMVLFSVICNQNKGKSWKSWLHADGTMYEDYFIVGITTPEGDYTYHYHKDYWDMFNVSERSRAHEWDGHQPEDIKRLNSLYEV